MQIQTKVTLLFFAATATVILLLSGFIFAFSNYYAFEDFYQRLETRVRLARDIYRNQDNDNSRVVQTLRQQYLEKLPSEQEYIIELTPGWQSVIGKDTLPEALLAKILKNGEARYNDGNKFFAGRIYRMASPPYMVIISATDPYGLEELNHLRQILLIGFVFSVVVVYVIGKLFSYQTFKPVRELTQKVQSITAENLNLRLDVGKGKDEITALGQTFNDMLNRLETAFETQNNFVSNASHELRTPLTIIKGEAELALRTPGLSEIHQHSVSTILQESEKLTLILSSLLGLAQSGFDGKKQHWEIIRIDELIWLVKEAVDQLYPQNNIKIDFAHLPTNEEQLQVSGNLNLLKLALSNIVANACKYSYNGAVIVSLRSEKNRVSIAVKDSGIGIPAQELPSVFVPFFRASNTTAFEGYGIGLPLSLNIIRLHKGSIALSSQEGVGTEIRVILPTMLA
jgi:signal transduction histidine kinase